MNITELKVELLRKGMSISDLAIGIGTSKQALCSKLKRGGDLRISDIKQICNYLNIDDNRMLAIFFGNGVENADTLE